MPKVETMADPVADPVAELKAEVAALRAELHESRAVSALLDHEAESPAERRLRLVRAEKKQNDDLMAATDAQMLAPWRDLLKGEHLFLIGIEAPRSVSGTIVGVEVLPLTGRVVFSDDPSPHAAREKYELHLCGRVAPEILGHAKVIIYRLTADEARELRERFVAMIDAGCEYGVLNKALHQVYCDYREKQLALTAVENN